MRIRKCLLLTIFVFIGSNLQAGDYLLRVQPVRTVKSIATKMKGTLEFHVTPGHPFLVRSTLGEDSQIFFKGKLREIDSNTYEIEYYCQIAELRADPNPRLTRKGKIKVEVYGEEILASKLSTEKNLSPLDFIITLKPLRPYYGAMEKSSGFAVRLVDPAGKPVAGARAGLYGILDEAPGDLNLEGKTNNDGLYESSEGRESLPTKTFYAEHKGRKLYAVANLNVDKIRAKGHKYFTLTMTHKLKRWKKPKGDVE